MRVGRVNCVVTAPQQNSRVMGLDLPVDLFNQNSEGKRCAKGNTRRDERNRQTSMARGRQQWRDTRSTLPAARKRRRHHRRDVQRGASFDPPPVAATVARAGVRQRLLLAIVAMGFSVFCGMLVLFGAPSYFGSAALAMFGFTALSLAIASILAARNEESIHRLANHLDRPLLTEHGEDGSL